jgi:hypothetical protein
MTLAAAGQPPASSSQPGPRDGRATEASLRRRLGIPQDAERVLVFSESSHWDTNWLETSDEYFVRRLEPIFAAIIAALLADPERVYCVESVFFLKLFWERHPTEQPRLRDLIERRQLRVLTSSFTTPDTLLPHPEAILRDFHLGQRWLHRQGLHITPRTAYFPDNFGHSPHLPSLMRAVGVDSIALTRIDGMYFIASDFRFRSEFPRRGSTAEVLEKELRTLDFVWKDDDGAELLCHWNAFTYFQGDMLAHAGVVRWNGLVAAIPWRTRGHVARRIDGFVRQLAPLARTPYMLCPIGMDFNDPVDRPRELFARYNDEHYPRSGVWAVLAGMDDYLELVGCHRGRLPVLAVDPNPYWMGFYASRPELKQRPTRVARSLLLAESLSAFRPVSGPLEASLERGWENLVLLNHHDAITGTSPDRVTHGEQRGWLDAAEEAADRAVALACEPIDHELPRAPPASPVPVVRWRDRELHVQTSHHTLTFSKERGGCLTSLLLDGNEQLEGLGLDLVAYADDGGLWRLGHEYRGGRFDAVDRASRRPARVSVATTGETVSIVVESTLGGMGFVRTVTCAKEDPLLHVQVAGFAARRQSVTCSFALKHDPVTLEMDTLGGHIVRPRERGHSPTFWPVPSRVTLRGAQRSFHVGFEAPTAVSFSPSHALEWIVARNPVKERAFGVLPVLAHPIGGTVDERQTHRAALFATNGNDLPGDLRVILEGTWLPPGREVMKRIGDGQVRCDDPAVFFEAIKRADRGPGVIVRLVCEEATPRPLRISIAPHVGVAVAAAFQCDAREEDVEPLEVDGTDALFTLCSRMATLRLLVR